MSCYQRYPSYKDSGIEWLGKVPEYWGIGLLSSLFSDNKEKNVGLKNSNLLSLSYGNIIQKDIDTSIGLLPESFDSYQIVHPGYIVLRLTDLQNDKKSLRTGFVRETGIITSAYVGLAKKSHSIGNEKYFYLYLHTFDAYKGFYGMGAGVRQGLNFDELKKLKFTLPPLEEQNLIVKYIEKKTAKIDTLIAKQQRMIELLGEKRSALISHAVTKGLNSDVAMKDSGVEWLGEVPEHWGIPKLIQKSSRIGDGLHSTPTYQEGTGYYFINGNNLVENEIIIGATGKEVPYEEYKNHYIDLNEQSVLMSINGTIGNVARYNNEPIILGKSAAYINCGEELNPKYLLFYLKSDRLKHYYDLEVTGTTIYNLSLNSIRKLKVCIPPKDEQIEISEYCEIQEKKFNTLITKARQAIELMKERRTALISAAVTGKIDVRGMV